MTKKILFIPILLLLVGSTYTYLYPVKCTSKCNDEDVLRYRFGIYTNNRNVTPHAQLRKTGRLLAFVNLKEIKSVSELLKEHYK